MDKTADVKGMIRELADWELQCFPLSGGDVIKIMVRFGIVGLEDAERYFQEFLTENGVSLQRMMPTGDSGEDDKIPF